MASKPAAANQQKNLASQGKIDGGQAKVDNQERQDVGLGAVKVTDPKFRLSEGHWWRHHALPRYSE
jgi:hypothetical protein